MLTNRRKTKTEEQKETKGDKYIDAGWRHKLEKKGEVIMR